MINLADIKLRWILTGATVGIALGIVVGVLISGGTQSANTEKSFEKATKASSLLGWEKLEEYVDITESYLNISELEPLKNDLAKGFKNKYSGFVHVKDDTTKNQTSQDTTEREPQFEAPQKSGINPSFSNKKYKDGFGEISVFDATLDEIDKIKYVSKPAAEAVYKHVQSNKITNFDELLNLKGVGPKTVERLRENFHIK